jgi:putative acyl-CoA dehydrogenase
MPFVAEAMEVLGGIGYCEESELPGFTGKCR